MHNYEYDFDIHGQSAPSFVVQMVGHKKEVLEIGAGPGSISRILIDNGCSVEALEIDPKAIEILSKYCKQIYSLDLNDQNWTSTFENKKFDLVVAADVLEHLVNPWQTLKRMTSLIKEDGKVVLSLPHAGHSSIIASLLNENFSYKDIGLLDKTHIRFFGLKNMEDLVAEANLKIIEAKFVLISPALNELHEQWPRLNLLERLYLMLRKEGYIYQVVVKLAHLNDPAPQIILQDIVPKISSRNLFIPFMKTFVKSVLPSWFYKLMKKVFKPNT